MELVSGTVADAFERSVNRYPGHEWLDILPETAQAYGVEVRSWTYADAMHEVVRLRQCYVKAGLVAGQRVGLMLQNRPEFIFHWLALNALGVSIVPLNADWRAAELEYVFGHSEVVVAVAPAARDHEILSAARAAGRSVVLGRAATGPLEAIRQTGPAGAAVADANTECALLYTSGTTGRPKGCILTNEYFLWAGQWYGSIGGLCEVRPGVERMLTPLPLTHMNALAYSAMCMMMAGGCLIVLDRFHPGSWWQSVRQSRASIVHYLGVMPALLLAAPATADDQAHCVRFGFGAGVAVQNHAPFEQRFGFPLLEAWAMTETGAGAVIIANHEPRHVGTACFGRAESVVQCRLVDDAGRDVSPEEAGELWVRRAGSNPRSGFFAGYLKDEAATNEAWAEGWFHTGDLVKRAPDGSFRFVDRKKNMIRRSGENISAVEVESVLAQHPAIAAVGVCPVPDVIRGDEVCALVVPKEKLSSPDQLAADIADFCRARLAYFKAPGYVAFQPRLPLTATAKIQRGELRQLGAQLLRQGHCIDLRSLKKRSA